MIKQHSQKLKEKYGKRDYVYSIAYKHNSHIEKIVFNPNLIVLQQQYDNL